MPTDTFDFAIIGAGAAGLHLALALCDESFFAEKKILILEKDLKNQNDRTWCFWEKGPGKWDKLLRHEWLHGDFFYMNDAIPLDLAPYRYKMLRGLDFYTFAKNKLAARPQFTWINEEVIAVENGNTIHIRGTKSDYSAEYVFDSRIPAAFLQPQDGNVQYTHLHQPFKGWVVRTPDDRFDPMRFNMMDYRLQWKDATSFTYLLPINPREALVEFTLFTPTLIAEQDFDVMLLRYMNEVLKIEDFEIIETEQGNIPMSDFPFEKYSEGKHIRIGTAGGWGKPSSGYAFKNCERNAQRILDNLKDNRPINQGIISPRFRFYDSVFLDVLYRHNHLGPGIFHSMYLKNSVQTIFAFLDEETSLAKEIGIIAGFPKLLFTRSLLNYLARYPLRFVPPLPLMSQAVGRTAS